MAKKVHTAPTTTAQTPKNVPVKSGAEMIASFNTAVEYIFHTRIKRSLSNKTQVTIISYGPWIMTALHVLVLPALLLLAKEGRLIGISTFLSTIFFNQSSWVLLLVILANCLLLTDGLSDVFAKKRRGWQRLYTALLINSLYVITQLVQKPTQFAAPLISLIILAGLLFATLDVKKYYR